ncbi:MAG TPA: hypothetical protein VGC92_03900 [Phenylobacterium sp.]|jgi:hypothetical protein
MSDNIRLWVETSFHSAFRCGGWAFVRADRGGLAGKAGGLRDTTDAGTARAGLCEALAGLPPTAEVHLSSASQMVLRAPGLAGLGAEPASPEDAAFWSILRPLLVGRRVTFMPAKADPRTPVAFTAAWAEQGRDKAKARGAFAAVIPRSNLAGARVQT